MKADENRELAGQVGTKSNLVEVNFISLGNTQKKKSTLYVDTFFRAQDLCPAAFVGGMIGHIGSVASIRGEKNNVNFKFVEQKRAVSKLKVDRRVKKLKSTQLVPFNFSPRVSVQFCGRGLKRSLREERFALIFFFFFFHYRSSPLVSTDHSIASSVRARTINFSGTKTRIFSR